MSRYTFQELRPVAFSGYVEQAAIVVVSIDAGAFEAARSALELAGARVFQLFDPPTTVLLNLPVEGHPNGFEHLDRACLIALADLEHRDAVLAVARELDL